MFPPKLSSHTLLKSVCELLPGVLPWPFAHAMLYATTPTLPPKGLAFQDAILDLDVWLMCCLVLPRSFQRPRTVYRPLGPHICAPGESLPHSCTKGTSVHDPTSGRFLPSEPSHACAPCHDCISAVVRGTRGWVERVVVRRRRNVVAWVLSSLLRSVGVRSERVVAWGW
jgi:hypothetical protein